MIREVRTKKGVLYVIFNNHYRAQQIKNALEFLHKITSQKVQVMPKLLNAYPQLHEIALSNPPPKNGPSRGGNYSLFGE
jgi:hypothetical protein